MRHHESPLSSVRRSLAALPADALALRLPRTLPPVAVDRWRLEQALAALADHAVRRSPPGGRVLVRAEPIGRGEVEIRVADRGPDLPGESKHWMLRLPALRQLAGVEGVRLRLLDNPSGGLLAVLVLPVAAARRRSVRWFLPALRQRPPRPPVITRRGGQPSPGPAAPPPGPAPLPVRAAAVAGPASPS